MLRCAPTIAVAAAIAAGIVSAGACVAPRAAAAAELQISVDESQRVTVSGSAPSLREAITQMCAAADVELRGWQAEDRAFTAHIEGEPLARVLERLLRGETYMLGVRQGPEGAALVRWVRVMGDGPDTSGYRGRTAATPPDAAPAPAPDLDPYFGVPASVTQAALFETDPAKRQAAVDTIVGHFSANPAAVEQFLARDSDETVAGVGGSAHAVALLKSIQGTQSDSSTRWRIEGLIRSVQFQQRKPKRDFFSGGLRP